MKKYEPIAMPFGEAIQKGLGRAFIQVRDSGAQGLKEDILNACLQDLAYDAQCDNSRAEWLLAIADLTGEPEFYHDRILAALPDVTEEEELWDANQLVELAAILAQRGSERARQAVYRKFDLQEFDASWLGAEQIIEIDGIKGLLHIAEILGAKLLREPEHWEGANLVSEASELYGKEAVVAALSERAEISANVRAYIDEITKRSDFFEPNKSKKKKSSRQTDRDRPTVEYIISKIEAGANWRYYGGVLGQRASDGEIEYLFERLLAETRREQLLRYLWLFRKREFPRLDDRLFELAASDDEEIQHAAIVGLAHTKDTSIRNLANRLLREKPRSICHRALKLYNKNYEPEDCQLIESVLTLWEDSDWLHDIAFDLIHFIKAQEDPQLANLLFWAYERTPCAICRQYVVEDLLKRKQAPETLLQECFWDGDKEIRALAKSALPDSIGLDSGILSY
ncbi:MAG: hypothetical protein F6J93_20725 [Oscillatoria sp. SIO1A7]|nr:hypothetical protein [Oscillatoria sp. SIO1A7]